MFRNVHFFLNRRKLALKHFKHSSIHNYFDMKFCSKIYVGSFEFITFSSLLSRRDGYEITSPKRIRLSENTAMAKPIFRIEESKLIDKSRAEWTSMSDVPHQPGHPFMESEDFLNNKVCPIF